MVVELQKHGICGSWPDFPSDSGPAWKHAASESAPFPPDGLAVVGPVPNLPECHVATTHGGITLAGLVGNLCSQHVLRPGESEIAELGPERFLKNAPKREDFRLWSPEIRSQEQTVSRQQV